MLRYAIGEGAAADAIESAVKLAIEGGLRTGDIYSEGSKRVGTTEMGQAIAAAI
jgi:3-isopropylmalate dehydrogenase